MKLAKRLRLCLHNERKSKREAGKTGGSLTVYLFLVTCYSGVASCAFWQAPEVQLPLQTATREELTELLRAREQSLQTVKGLFTAQVKGSGIPIAHTVYGTIFYRRPDALRLQGFSRFGTKLFDFMLEPGRYELHLPKEGKVLRGLPADLERRQDISQPLTLSILAMTGLIGIASVGQNDRVVLTEDGDRYRLDVHAPQGLVPHGETPMRRIWFERASFNVVREERLTAEGELEGTLDLDDFREVSQPADKKPANSGSSVASAPLVLPFEILAESGQGAGSIRVVFSELIPNVDLGEQDFQVALWSASQDTRGRRP